MKYLISDWNRKIQNSLDQIQKAKEIISNLGEGEYKNIQESGAARLQAQQDLKDAEGAGWWTGTVVREEIVKKLKYYRKDLNTEDFVKICQIYNDSLSLPLLSGIELQESEAAFKPFLEEWSAWRKEREEKGLEKTLEIEKTPELPKRKEKKLRSRTFKTYEAAEKWSLKNHGGAIIENTMGGYWVEYYIEDTDAPETLMMCLGCDKKLHKKELKVYKKDTFYCPECSKLFDSGLSRFEVRKIQSQKGKEEIIEELIEEPKEEIKEIKEVEEEKKEDKEEPKEEKKEKNKKLSKTAKAKIKREKRKIKKIQEKEKELRKLEREEKKLLKEQEKIEKELRKVRKAKKALLAKLNKTPEGSEGGETEGNGGKRGKEGDKEEFKGFSKASRIKESKEQIKEEDKEDWKKTKSLLSRRRRAITEQGFKTILRDIANSKGEPKKVKSAIKKAKKYIEKIEVYEDLIRYSVRFASWAPAWFTNKSKVVLKLKTLVTNWLEKNEEKKEDKEDKKETPKAKIKGDSGNSEGGETEGNGGKRGGEEGDKEEPKEELKESQGMEKTEEEIEETSKIEEREEIIEEVIEEPKEEVKEASEIEETEEFKKPSKREWREFKQKVGTRRRYISCNSEIGWIAGRAEYKTKNLKGELLENYKNLKKGLQLIEAFEELLDSSKRFAPWAPRWFRGQAPMVWKIQRFIKRWLEENRRTLIVKFAYREDIPEEYKEEAEKYRKEQEYWNEVSRKYWAKRIAEVKAKRAKELAERGEKEE